MAEEAAYFRRTDDGVFIGGDAARGPWAADYCHAGPVAGLLARAAEAVVGDDKQLTRLTVDLLRPIPLSGFRIEAELVRAGGKLSTAKAVALDPDDAVLATAISMHLAPAPETPMPTVPVRTTSRRDAAAGRFPVAETNHGQPAFADFIEVAYPPGQDMAPGPTCLWMRTPPLLSGEPTSPFQSLCPLADCGSGISRNAALSEVNFMNCDLTIHAHRPPATAWLLSESTSHWQSSGLGLTTAILSDEQGPVAVALQTLLLKPMRR